MPSRWSVAARPLRPRPVRGGPPSGEEEDGRLTSVAPWRGCGGAHRTIPGWSRRRAGKGFVYLDETGARLPPDDVERVEGPGHPACLARRLDLPLAERAPPGRRHRRRRPAAVPLPPRLAHPARRRQARPGARVRPRAVEGARAGAGRPRHRGHEPGPRLCRRRTAARPRLLPDRQRRVRRGERELRTHHAPAAARPQAGRHDGLRLRRQVRDRAQHHHRRPRHRAGARDHAAASRAGRRGADGLEGRAPLARPRLRPRQRLRPSYDGPRRDREGLPHLARDRDRRRRRWPSPPSRATPRRHASGPRWPR